MLQYENTAVVGDTIKAYDFQPFPGRSERYVIGKVIEIDTSESLHGFHCYKILCEVDTGLTGAYSRVGDIVLVPHEITFEYDGRVVNLSTANQPIKDAQYDNEYA